MVDLSAGNLKTNSGAGRRRAGGAGRWRAPVVWGGSGFLIGAMFWHAVGFWSFVSDIVYNPRAGAEMTSLPVRKNDVRAADALRAAAVAPQCVKLLIDRGAGETRSAACLSTDRLLPHAGVGTRQNLAALRGTGTMAASRGWTVTADQGQ